MTKIQTTVPTQYGKVIRYNTVDVKFDRIGVAEVEDEVAEQIVATYVGMVIKYDEAPKQAPKTSSNDKEVNALQKELERAAVKLTEKDATIEATKRDLEAWKEQVGIFKEGQEKAEFDLSEFKAAHAKQVEELELQVKLVKMPVKDLTEFCVKLGIPEESYKDKNKDSLIQLILDASRK